MELPKQITVEINPDIVKKAGDYSNGTRCPLATFFLENYPPPNGYFWYAYSDKVVLTKIMNKLSDMDEDPIYMLNDCFLSKDMDLVKKGRKFTTLAIREESQKID